jgi:hypothetical protein
LARLIDFCAGLVLSGAAGRSDAGFWQKRPAIPGISCKNRQQFPGVFVVIDSIER